MGRVPIKVRKDLQEVVGANIWSDADRDNALWIAETAYLRGRRDQRRLAKLDGGVR